MKFNPRFILPFFILSLLVGIIGGLTRMGCGIDFPANPAHHGLIMTGGFLGGLITLERTVTMKNRLWLIFPSFAATSIPILFLGQVQWAIALVSFCSLGLTVLYLRQMFFHRESYWQLLLAGSLFWLIGNIKLLQSGFVPASTNWWIGFVLFTILGERLELNRFVPTPSPAKWIVWTLLIALAVSIFLPFHSSGIELTAVLIICVTAWFLRYDLARISVFKNGIFRFTGASILVAYGWLVIHALIILMAENHVYFYDLYLHTFFLGFAFSMIWAHAPSILPAVLKINVKIYHPLLWVFWWIFQLSLAGRVAVTFFHEQTLRKFLAMANGIAILLMLVAIMAIFFSRLNQQKRAAR